jgi:hypothetical protein
MRFLFQLGLLALSWVAGTQATALDDYVWAHDDNYKWTDMVINFLVPFTFKDSLSCITTKQGPQYAFNSSVDTRPYQGILFAACVIFEHVY